MLEDGDDQYALAWQYKTSYSWDNVKDTQIDWQILNDYF